MNIQRETNRFSGKYLFTHGSRFYDQIFIIYLNLVKGVQMTNDIFFFCQNYTFLLTVVYVLKIKLYNFNETNDKI